MRHAADCNIYNIFLRFLPLTWTPPRRVSWSQRPSPSASPWSPLPGLSRGSATTTFNVWHTLAQFKSGIVQKENQYWINKYPLFKNFNLWMSRKEWNNRMANIWQKVWILSNMFVSLVNNTNLCSACFSNGWFNNTDSQLTCVFMTLSLQIWAVWWSCMTVYIVGCWWQTEADCSHRVWASNVASNPSSVDRPTPQSLYHYPPFQPTSLTFAEGAVQCPKPVQDTARFTRGEGNWGLSSLSPPSWRLSTDTNTVTAPRPSLSESSPVAQNWLGSKAPGQFRPCCFWQTDFRRKLQWSSVKSNAAACSDHNACELTMMLRSSSSS